MGNGQNLVGRKPLDSYFEQDRLNPGDPGLTFSWLFGIKAQNCTENAWV